MISENEQIPPRPPAELTSFESPWIVRATPYIIVLLVIIGVMIGGYLCIQ